MNGLPHDLVHPGRKANLVKVLLILILLAFMAQPAFAQNANPNVAPPNSKPYGKSYGEWSVEWWKYVMAFPAPDNPLADPTGANCGVGQTGPVFFLVGTTGGPAVRNCVVPVGKSIFFPIINVISAVPEDATNAEDLISLVDWYFDHVDYVEVTVDKVDLRNLLGEYRFSSPVFSFFGASPGIFAPMYEGYREIAYSDGWWIMLHPLTPGPHTIHFLGHLIVPEWGNYEFTTEVTYNLTVGK